MGGLIILSAILVVTLEDLRLPAALLLGPRGAGILDAANGMTLRIPRWLFLAAQAVIGCMIVRDTNLIGPLS